MPIKLKKEVNEVISSQLRGENVVLAKFKKRQERDDKYKKWNTIDDAVSAARSAYMGSYEPKESEKTISFEKAVGDLMVVLEKIQKGQIKSTSRGLEVEAIA
jgi:hypothetical protein